MKDSKISEYVPVRPKVRPVLAPTSAFKRRFRYECAVTARQEEMYQYILGYRAENGFSPSVEDIRVRFGCVSRNGIMDQLQALSDKRLLTWHTRTSRSFVPAGHKLVDVPERHHAAVLKYLDSLLKKEAR